ATVVAEGRIADLLERLRAAQDLPEVPDRPEGFVGELRPYQRRGVAWLQGMADLGFGAVLADAMGLGKTVQLIAMLVSRPGPFLVVCPTSVVGNWLRELARFAPDLPLIRHHGTDRPTDLTLQVTSAEPDAEPTPGPVVVTSYGTLRRAADLQSAIGRAHA